ncbi:MAG: (d)CMP kinase [Erysipelotrichaceae bacterium]|nr:(d)CMP kinase [Erysipelotrichaceae bacterium]
MKINIAIDGPAAAGKSTIAKILAKKLDYTYIDTGAMYRCVAYFALINDVDPRDEDKVCRLLKDIHIDMKGDKIYLNGDDVSKKIRDNAVSMYASSVSQYKDVREFLVFQQRQLASLGGVILDGRDIGTVVLPNAQLKIYQIASIDCRALRRHKENIERGLDSSLEEIKSEIESRDYQDMHRNISPLKKADDAIEIDTSDMTLEEVSQTIYQLALERMNDLC